MAVKAGDARNGYTPTQERILEMLKDGMRHHRSQVLEAIEDTEASLGCLQQHISILRKKLQPKGQDIICEIYNRTSHYRWVRLLSRD